MALVGVLSILHPSLFSHSHILPFIVMGKIPAQNRMVSTILLNPQHNQNLQANQEFQIQLRVNNLAAGFFTNAQATYYSAPQDLNGQGQVIGHTHVVIQDLGNSLTPNQPLDASTFVFFKGINDAGQNGVLSATVTGGLPNGNYRVCTMSGASNHQPVLMPVAQRGTQEDCNKFTVGAAANNNQGNQNQGNQNQGNQNQGNQNQGNQNQGNNNQGNQGNNNGGGRGGGRGNQGQSGSNTGNGNNTGGNTANNSATKTNAQASSTTAAAAAASTTAARNNNNNNGGGGRGNGNNNNNNNQGNNNAGGQGGATASKALGGIAAPAVSDSGDSKRPFAVNGNTFVNKSAAVQRACDVQNNACADAVNGGKLSGVTVSQCGSQVAQCVQELS
jgi:transcription initiation factor TFIID subunit 15